MTNNQAAVVVRPQIAHAIKEMMMHFFDRIGIALSLLCPLIGLAIFVVVLLGGLVAYYNLQAALEHAAAVLPQ